MNVEVDNIKYNITHIEKVNIRGIEYIELKGHNKFKKYQLKEVKML